MNMKYIEKLEIINIDNFKLYIAFLKVDCKFEIIGVLKDENEVIEYCNVNEIAEYDKAKNIFDTYIKYQVFPNHFYYVIDDLCY